MDESKSPISYTSQCPFKTGKLAVVENPRDSNEIIIFPGYDVNTVFSYHITREQYTQVNQNSIYPANQSPTAKWLNVVALNGVKPNSIIVFGRTNVVDQLYLVFDCQTMKWQPNNDHDHDDVDTTSISSTKNTNHSNDSKDNNSNNTSTTGQTVNDVDNLGKFNRVNTNKDTTEVTRHLFAIARRVCSFRKCFANGIKSTYLIASGSTVPRFNNEISVYLLHNKTQYPIKLVNVLKTPTKSNKEYIIRSKKVHYQYKQHGMIILPKNCNTMAMAENKNANENENAHDTNEKKQDGQDGNKTRLKLQDKDPGAEYDIRLLLFGGYLHLFVDSFLEVDIKFTDSHSNSDNDIKSNDDDNNDSNNDSNNASNSNGTKSGSSGNGNGNSNGLEYRFHEWKLGETFKIKDNATSKAIGNYITGDSNKAPKTGPAPPLDDEFYDFLAHVVRSRYIVCIGGIRYTTKTAQHSVHYHDKQPMIVYFDLEDMTWYWVNDKKQGIVLEPDVVCKKSVCDSVLNSKNTFIAINAMKPPIKPADFTTITAKNELVYFGIKINFQNTLQWKEERIIWIGFYKNGAVSIDNDDEYDKENVKQIVVSDNLKFKEIEEKQLCLIAKLPKDVVFLFLSFLRSKNSIL